MKTVPTPPRSRRVFLRRLGWAGLSVTGFASYIRFVEPRWLGISRQDVPLGGGAGERPVRLLHLSDFHASRVVPLSFVREAIEVGLAQRPEVVCITGDFITAQLAAAEEYSRILALLPRAAPTFACLGNHDGGTWAGSTYGYADTTVIRQVLSAAGIPLLHNEARRVALAGRSFNFAGTGDLWAGELDAEATFARLRPEPGIATILLSHNPDGKDELPQRPWNLMLSGHTHGGQMRLPLLGAPFAPVQDTRFVQGLHPWNQRWLHITKGVGNLHGLRFNCRPEISVLTLT